MRMPNSTTVLLNFHWNKGNLCCCQANDILRWDTFSSKIDSCQGKRFVGKHVISVNGMNENIAGWYSWVGESNENLHIHTDLLFYKSKSTHKQKERKHAVECNEVIFCGNVLLLGSLANCLGQFIWKHYHSQTPSQRLSYSLRMIWWMATILSISYSWLIARSSGQHSVQIVLIRNLCDSGKWMTKNICKTTFRTQLTLEHKHAN